MTINNNKGFTLIEIVISVALIAVLGVALMQGLSAIARGQGIHDDRISSLIAARTQVESIKKALYDNTVTSTPGPGYSSLPALLIVNGLVYDIQIIAQQIETGVQIVTVVVTSNGKETTRLQAYKVMR